MGNIFASIRYTVRLAVQLINSASGTAVLDTTASFLWGEKALDTVKKSDGIFVFLDCPEESFWLEVNCYGYGAKSVYVDFEVLHEGQAPFLQIHLTPDKYCKSDTAYHVLEGSDPAITHIEAVKSDEILCQTKAFDEESLILTVFNPHNLQMDKVFYAIVNKGESTYEGIKIAGRISNTKYKLKYPLKQGLQADYPIARLIYGTADKNGGYIIKMRNNNSSEKYILRYIKSNKEYFKQIDFSTGEKISL